MKFEKDKDGNVHIYVEGHEGEFEVLRAIVQASFDLARPAGLGFLHFNQGTKLPRNDAEKFIRKPLQIGGTVVDMDYVEGRQCKTTLRKIENAHFLIYAHSFERDRGDVMIMLNHAQEIILKDAKPGDPTDSSTMYKGEALDKRLKEYGFMRNSGESDWDFRKRIFPDLHLKTRDGRAYEFLVGASVTDFNDMEQMLFLAMSMGSQDRYTLAKFANDFNVDPMEIRGEGKLFNERLSLFVD